MASSSHQIRRNKNPFASPQMIRLLFHQYRHLTLCQIKKLRLGMTMKIQCALVNLLHSYVMKLKMSDTGMVIYVFQ